MTGRTLEAWQVESQARVDARRVTPTVRRMHLEARHAFVTGSPWATEPAGVGYRIALPAWHAQREQHPTRKRRGRPTTWRPVFDALSLNARVHNAVRGRVTSQVRGHIASQAGPRRAALPEGDHLRVRLVYRPAHPGTRDATNLQPLQKALVDGLARGPRKTRTRRVHGQRVEVPVSGLDLVPDDCEPWVTEWPPLILEPQGPAASGLWLDVLVTSPRGVIDP